LGAQPGEVSFAQRLRPPPEEGVVDQGVLYVDEDADARIDSRQLLDDEDGDEERSLRAPERFRNVHAHQPHLEELATEAGIRLLGLVHPRSEGSYLVPGELPYRVPGGLLVVAEEGQWRAGSGKVDSGHEASEVRVAALGIARVGGGCISCRLVRQRPARERGTGRSIT